MLYRITTIPVWRCNRRNLDRYLILSPTPLSDRQFVVARAKEKSASPRLGPALGKGRDSSGVGLGGSRGEKPFDVTSVRFAPELRHAEFVRGTAGEQEGGGTKLLRLVMVVMPEHGAGEGMAESTGGPVFPVVLLWKRSDFFRGEELRAFLLGRGEVANTQAASVVLNLGEVHAATFARCVFRARETKRKHR